MPALRISSASLVTPSSPAKLRIASVSVAGGVFPRLRISHAEAAGAVRVRVLSIQPLTVEPLDLVSLTAYLESALVADSFSWDQVSGDSISLEGSGNTRTFKAPASTAGTTIVVGVTATKGGVTSPEVQATVTVLPQIEWILKGGAWVPLIPALLGG